jgi:hypothetical protein
VLNYLSVLHDISNFPILPYFYQTVLEGNDYFFEHFVIPVSFTDSFSYENSIKEKNNKENHTALYALFSIKPTPDKFKKNIINSIQTFFTFISLPINDACFYGNIYKTNIENESFDSLIETFSHETWKIIHSLTNRAVELENLFDIKATYKNPEKVGLIELNSDYKIQDFRIIPNNMMFDAAIQYLKFWTRGDNKIKSVNDLIEKCYYIHLITNDSALKSFPVNDKNSLDFFNSRIIKNIEILKKQVVLSEDISDEKHLDKRYIQLLYATIINSLQHLGDLGEGCLKIDIHKSDAKFVSHSIISLFVDKSDNWSTEENDKVESKRQEKKGSGFQIEKILKMIGGNSLEFKAEQNRFIVKYNVPITKIYKQDEMDND